MQLINTPVNVKNKLQNACVLPIVVLYTDAVIHIPYMRKFSQYVIFAIKPLIRIFVFI